MLITQRGKEQEKEMLIFFNFFFKYITHLVVSQQKISLDIVPLMKHDFVG